jgi:hypothetical protein
MHYNLVLRRNMAAQLAPPPAPKVMGAMDSSARSTEIAGRGGPIKGDLRLCIKLG